MIRIFFTLFLLIVHGNSVQAQRDFVFSIDAHADTLKREDFDDLYALTDKLVLPAKSNHEKVRALCY